MSVNNSKRTILTPIVLSLVMITGIYIGLKLSAPQNRTAGFIYPGEENKISKIIDFVESEYVDSVDKNELIENAIPEILKGLDPHSVYIPATNAKEVQEPIEGNFEGIGVQFNMPDDTVVVVQTISLGPSEKVGILPGDRIVTIDDSLVAGKKISTTGIMKLLKGPKGTKVVVGIMRKGHKDLLDFEITRDKIPLYSIDVAYMLDDKTGYIKLTSFAKTTYHEFRDAIEKLEKAGMQNLVFDLRSNGGGIMEIAINLANEFLDANKLIVYTQGRSRPKSESYSNNRGLCLNTKLVVLVDEWSASASEIVAGAIQDNDRGTVVGRRTFGKGLVQQPTMFSDGSVLRLTIARYYTPSGRCIQKSYENGNEDYFEDLMERYEKGEFTEIDSIKQNDSLKYFTAGGRIVYGGGGIMPDIFVPLDTTGQTDYYNKIFRKGLIYRFAFNFVDNKRDFLAKYTNIEDLEKYLDKQSLLSDFVNFSEENGVKKNKAQIEESRELLTTVIKASIARNVLDNEGFYPIMHKIDKTLKRALEEFE